MQQFLRYEDVPLDQLTQYPGNARRNDVDKLVKSIQHHGQYRTLVVRQITEDDDKLVIVAGNHTYQALCKIASDPMDEFGLSSTTARCEIMECTDREALEINLVDNRTNDTAFYDEDAMRTQLEELNNAFEGTGWDEKSAGKYLDDPYGDADDQGDPPASFNILVICRDEEQQTDLLDKFSAEGLECKALLT